MSAFEVKTYPVKITPHGNADNLEIANIGDYKSCVLKGEFKDDDIVAYIPEGSVVPENILKEIGLDGKLSGPTKDRVRAVRLRGVVSQGIIYPTDEPVGVDVSELYGITKYVPPLPSTLRGNVDNRFGKTVRYDIENIKKYPDVVEIGEEVRFTEKIHGTWTCLGLFDKDTPIVTSKGLSTNGLAFKIDESNLKNVYVKMWHQYEDSVRELYEMYESPVYLIGETYGKVQDLKYGLGSKIDFRVFDIYVADTFDDSILTGHYLDAKYFDSCITNLNIESVPVLFDGPFMKPIMMNHTEGNSVIEGAEHVREGIVIKPLKERRDDEIGRVILKSINDDYLFRRSKKQTEFE